MKTRHEEGDPGERLQGREREVSCGFYLQGIKSVGLEEIKRLQGGTVGDDGKKEQQKATQRKSASLCRQYGEIVSGLGGTETKKDNLTINRVGKSEKGRGCSSGQKASRDNYTEETQAEGKMGENDR